MKLENQKKKFFFLYLTKNSLCVAIAHYEFIHLVVSGRFFLSFLSCCRDHNQHFWLYRKPTTTTKIEETTNWQLIWIFHVCSCSVCVDSCDNQLTNQILQQFHIPENKTNIYGSIIIIINVCTSVPVEI